MLMPSYKLILSASFILGLIFVTALLLMSFQSQQAQASIVQGQEYIATTTAANSVYGATITGSRIISKHYGSLSSVVITGANTGIVNFYDATTTNVSLRAPSMSTSSILIASFPASTAAGNYVFDATFANGLYIDLISGNMPTTTITYR